jgi:pimeloyl-ACP methyl ester carboxylesterase/class 3 adenylate cyclase
MLAKSDARSKLPTLLRLELHSQRLGFDGVACGAVDRPTRYALNGDVHIAYQVVGEGPIDLIYTAGIWSNLEIMWEWPAWARYLERLASFTRLILFDMRGVGLSDRGSQPPILELQADDVRAVIDAVGCDSAAVYGGARGAAAAMMFAASYPERVRALVLYAPVAKTVRSPDWPYGKTEEDQRAFVDRFVSEMGSGDNLDLQGPSYDERFKNWWAHFERLVATPGAYLELARIFTSLDIRQVLPAIQSPTLVLHRTEDRIVRVAQGRAVAERIPKARFVELPGIDHIPFLGDWDRLVAEIEEFLTGDRSVPEPDRVLATVLFTDIVGSTEMAGAIGDRAWRELLSEHRALVRRQLAIFRATERDTAGDGFMATFDGPARAIRCAQAILETVRPLGIEVRAGIHTGECELVETGLAGIAVHIASRVANSAGPGEVVVSSTVKDLVAGSGIRFSDIGTHSLKGVPEEWHLYRVAE